MFSARKATVNHVTIATMGRTSSGFSQRGSFHLMAFLNSLSIPILRASR